MPTLERQRLIENLQKFDLVYSPDQQRALRDLDRRDQRTRRCHGGPSTLRHCVPITTGWTACPIPHRMRLKEKAAGERMELIAKLVKEHPVVTHAATPRFLQFVDVGDYSPFELAAIYQIWQLMSACRATTSREIAARASTEGFPSKRRGEAGCGGIETAGFRRGTVGQRTRDVRREWQDRLLAPGVKNQGRRSPGRNSPPASDQPSFSRKSTPDSGRSRSARRFPGFISALAAILF